MTCYLALVGPRGHMHKVYVDGTGRALEARTLCGSLVVANYRLVAPPTVRPVLSCARCEKRLAHANRLGDGIEALRAGLRRVE